MSISNDIRPNNAALSQSFFSRCFTAGGGKYKNIKMQKFKFKKIEKGDYLRYVSLQFTTAQIKILYNALILDSMTDEPRDQDAAELLHTLQNYIETEK